MLKTLFRPFIWMANLIQNYFKTALFVLIVYLLFFSSHEISEPPNLYKIYLNTQIVDASAFLDEVKKAKDESIKGVLLLVDSPGGAVAPSVEMSLAIKELAQTKPVITYAMGTMASGSYYASIWSDTIISNPGSTIGSIGVRFEGYNIEELAQRLGIAFQGAHAGDYKNIGTYTREWTKEEKQELERLIEDTYAMFVADVANARNLDINQSSRFADGKVFLAQRALEVGLIDKIGSYNFAIEELKNDANVSEARFNEPDEIDRMMEKLADQASKTFVRFAPKLMSMI